MVIGECGDDAKVAGRTIAVGEEVNLEPVLDASSENGLLADLDDEETLPGRPDDGLDSVLELTEVRQQTGVLNRQQRFASR